MGTCVLALMSVTMLSGMLVVFCTHEELRQFPMNRLVPLFVMLLFTSVCLFSHRLLFLAGVIALDDVCVLAGHTYLNSLTPSPKP